MVVKIFFNHFKLFTTYFLPTSSSWYWQSLITSENTTSSQMRNNNSMLSSPQHPPLISRCSILLQCEQFHKFMTLLKCKVEYSNSKELFIFPYFSCSFATTKAILDSSGVCQNIKSFKLSVILVFLLLAHLHSSRHLLFSLPTPSLLLLLFLMLFCSFLHHLFVCAYVLTSKVEPKKASLSLDYFYNIGPNTLFILGKMLLNVFVYISFNFECIEIAWTWKKLQIFLKSKYYRRTNLL